MKRQLLLISFAAINTVWAQMSIGAPRPFDTLIPGQPMTVQLVEPISTSMGAGFEEVSVVIGIAGCGVSPCPVPTANLGEVLFIGQYEAQGEVGTTLSTFRNYTFTVPGDISGLATVNVQHVALSTPPDSAIPIIQYLGTAVQVGTGPSRNIHPVNDSSKCVSILGGVFANGSPVDIFDCNGSASQKWQWNDDSALVSINPADGSQWCLDAGDPSTWTNGLKMKIWQCFSGLTQQTWSHTLVPEVINIEFTDFCLDLTNGDKTNQNVLQIWQCSGDANQIWAWSFA